MATTPYLDLTAPLDYQEGTSGDVDAYTAYTDILGQPSRAYWVLNQVGSNKLSGTLNSPGDGSDVIPLYVPTGYAITDYTLVVNPGAINQARFSLNSNDGTINIDEAFGSTGKVTRLLDSDHYSVTFANGPVVASYTFSFNVVKVNEAPRVNYDYVDPTFTIGGSPVDLFEAVSITNESGQHLTQLTLKVDGLQDGASEALWFNGHAIQLVANGADSLGSGYSYTNSGNAGEVTIVIDLGTTTDAATLSALIDDMRYDNSSANAQLGERNVYLMSVKDDGGTLYGGKDIGLIEDWTIVTVEKPANAAPVVTVSNDPSTFTEGAGSKLPVIVDAGLTVTDSDTPTLASAKVTISANLKPGEDVLAFTATGAISASYDASTGILSLTASPPATLAEWQVALRSVTYSNTSDAPDTAERTISFVVNDGTSNSSVASKALTVVATNNPPTISAPQDIDVTEDIAQALTGINFADPDAGAHSVIVTLSVASGSLSATSASGVTVGGSSTALTLSGSITDINSYIAASHLQYLTAANATADVTLSISINDQANSGAGGAQSASTSLTLKVTAVNDAPMLVTSTGSANFTAGDNAFAPPVNVDPGLNLSDVDSTTLASASVVISSGFQAGEDLLGFINDGSTMGNISGSYNAATGVLNLSSASSNATLAQWQAALQAVTYSNSAVTPDEADRTITFIATDAEGAASNPVSRTLEVAGTEQTPVLDVGQGSTIYKPEDGPTPINAGITVSDLDSATLQSATVSISAGYASGDQLTFVNDGLSQGDITGTYDPATGVLSLASASASATLAQWQSALQAISFSTSSTDKSERSISFTISDGTKTSAAVSHAIAFDDSNDAPTISAPAHFSATEDVASALKGISFADVDAGSSAVLVTFSVASGTLAATSSSGVTVGGTPAALTLKGSLADINAFISNDNLTYLSHKDANDDVQVDVSINDQGNSGIGGAKSANTSVLLQITPVNDAPEVQAPTAAQSVRQGNALTFAGNSQIVLSDVDTSTGLTLTLTASHGILNLGSLGALTVVSGSDGSSDISLKGSLVELNAAISSLKFTPDNGYTGPATISVLLSDNDSGNPLSATKTIAVNVTPALVIPPVVTDPGTGGSAPVITNSDVVLPNGETGTSTHVEVTTEPGKVTSVSLAGNKLSADIPTGYGLTATGGASKTAANSSLTLKSAIEAVVASNDQAHQSSHGQAFLSKLPADQALLVQSITPTTTNPNGSLTLKGQAGELTALVIDATQMNDRGTLTLNEVEFAAIIGKATVLGATTGQTLVGDDASQTLVIGATNSLVFAGGGSDLLQVDSMANSKGSVLQGGQGDDTVRFTGDQSQYSIEQHGGYVMVRSNTDQSQAVKVINVERLSFDDGNLDLSASAEDVLLASLYQSVFSRQADLDGFDFWSQQATTLGQIAVTMMQANEKGNATLTGDPTNDIGQLYQVFFDRAADADGLAYWKQQVDSGALTFDQVAQYFLQSIEMTGHLSTSGNWDFTL